MSPIQTIYQIEQEDMSYMLASARHVMEVLYDRMV